MDAEKRNIFIATIISVGIMLGFQFFYEKPSAQTHTDSQKSVTTPQPTASPNLTTQPKALEREVARFIEIDTPSLRGKINLQGGRIDSISLKHYKETPQKDSPDLTLLHPKGSSEAPYYAEFGWVSSNTQLSLPSAKTPWSLKEGSILTSTSPLRLTWTSPEGLEFERLIQIDEQYMFTVTDTVINRSSLPVSLSFYGLINYTKSLPFKSNYTIHEGMIGYLDGKLKEISFKDLEDSKKESLSNVSGWMGITDRKYWLTALAIPGNSPVTSTYRFINDAGSPPRFQSDFVSPLFTVHTGEARQFSSYVFTGPKSVELLDAYESKLSIPHFDLAVDFGWFYFITKPFFFLLKWLYGVFGNLGVAIIILTLIIRLALFPLANKSFKSMAKMKALHPELEHLKATCGDDKLKLNQEMMQLYKKHKVNPASGCLPILIQTPFFIGIFKVLQISIEMRHAPFFGWIQDLSAADPTTIFNLFGLISWTPPSFLMIGALPIIMGSTMFLQQKMSPQPTDPTQAKMFYILPIVFTYIMADLPSGVVLYWTVSNIFSIAQQWFISDFLPRTKIHGKKV